MGLSHEDKSQFDKSFSRPWLTVVNYIFEHLVQLSASRYLNSIMWKVEGGANCLLFIDPDPI